MADIKYPATLPDFKTGKSRKEQQTYDTTQPFSGPLYIQKVTDESPVTWDITVTCGSKLQAIQFRSFLKIVKDGQLFDKDILTEEGHIEHEVRFVSMPLKPKQITPDIWEYSGVIMARALLSNNDDVDDGLIVDWLDGAEAIDIAMNDVWGS